MASEARRHWTLVGHGDLVDARISFIGGASMTWMPTFSQELLSCPELAGSTMVLMDTDQDHLDTMERYVNRMKRDLDGTMAIQTTTDREEALSDADFVVTTFMAGGHDAWATDLNIALKHGLQTPKGMSVGPGGLLQGLKAIPMIVGIAREMESLCPGAKLINYTNPMSSIVLGVQRYSKIPSVGVCPGLEHEVSRYARMLGVPEEELEVRAAGVNHCDFVLELRHRGRDVLPKVLELMAADGQEPISRMIHRIFGGFPTPGDIHIMEFFPYFMRQGKALEDWGQTHNYVENRIRKRGSFWSDLVASARGEGGLVTSYESREKLDKLICSSLFDRKDVFQLNVTNRGAIPNVLAEACVEVPTVVDAYGYHPVHFGPLPAGIAGICNVAATVQDLTVEAAMTGDRKLALQALLMDPLIYSMEIDAASRMLDEMLEAQRQWLPRFFS
jgi:alpha-galactosidase